jgi:hypothetical protein
MPHVTMNLLVKKILNSMRCPICRSPIDLLTGKMKYEYNFGCATNFQHYACYIDELNNPGNLEKERVIINQDSHQYEVKQEYFYYGVILTCTDIVIRQIDAENRVLEGNKIKEIKYDKILFDFQSTTPSKILNRVQTILTFQ